MATPDPLLTARINALERQVRDLTARVAGLEVILRGSPRVEHPLDRDTVQEKVSYDWQK
jgi:hypothetical protein